MTPFLEGLLLLSCNCNHLEGERVAFLGGERDLDGDLDRGSDLPLDLHPRCAE